MNSMIASIFEVEQLQLKASYLSTDKVNNVHKINYVQFVNDLKLLFPEIEVVHSNTVDCQLNTQANQLSLPSEVTMSHKKLIWSQLQERLNEA